MPFTLNTKFWSSSAGATGYGYVSGGRSLTAAINIIERFSYASEADSTDVGDLPNYPVTPASQSSSTHGYTCGGRNKPGPSPTPYYNEISKFLFTSSADATDVGDLTVTRSNLCGQYSASEGYSSGGWTGSAGSDVIDKFSFASDGSATDRGDLASINESFAGASSSTHGYTCGGSISGSTTDNINKFSFSDSNNATVSADLTLSRAYLAATQSSSHGYAMGGVEWSSSPTVLYDRIGKFAFASDSDATDVGNLVSGRGGPCGVASSTDGFSCGGYNYSGAGGTTAYLTEVNKFSFASDSDATNVLALTAATGFAGSSQSA